MAKPNDIAAKLEELKPKAKEPYSPGVLNSWIAKAEQEVDPSHSGRLAWLIATTVCAAKLQSIIDTDGNSRFALKGGTLLQHRLGLTARATKDLDGMIRGDIEEFLEALDSTLDEDWGPIGFQRSEIEVIQTPAKVIKPRRFDLILQMRGKTWRRVQIEISPPEGLASETFDSFAAPNLEAFGIPTPDHLVSLALSYQIAQKIHGATDPHDPPEFVNERARDLVDLVLLKELVECEETPTSDEIRAAIIDVFESRAKEAQTLGRPERSLPVKVTSYPHWKIDYEEAAKASSVEQTMEEAMALVNGWLADLFPVE